MRKKEKEIEKRKSKMEIFQPDDVFFKKVLEVKESAKANIETFSPHIAQRLDLDRLEQKKDTFIKPELITFKSDVIYRCPFKDSQEELNICMIWENKSEPDEFVMIQAGLYLMLALNQMTKGKTPKLEPVVIYIFYNGKKDWTPKTMKDLFKEHPHFELFEQYLPIFEIIFVNIAKFSLEELLAIKFRFFRSAMVAMSLRHNADLFYENISIIFDVDDKDQLMILGTYYWGIVERSPKRVREKLKNVEFTIKTKGMSTLQMFKNEGKIEGKIEERKGWLLDKLQTFLNLLKHFPDLNLQKCSVVIQMPMDAITKVKNSLDTMDIKKVEATVLPLFFDKLKLNKKEQKKLEQIIEDYYKKD